MPENIPLNPIQLWGALGAVVVLLIYALMAYIKDWVVSGSRYRALQETCNTRIKELEQELKEERQKRETVVEASTAKMDQLRDELQSKLEDTNRLLLDATETFQRMRRR